MPKLICYSQLLDSPQNLSQSITTDLLLLKMLEYYLVSISTTPQKMTPEPKDWAEEILYAFLLFFANDENIFLSEDLSLRPDKDKEKDLIHPWELVADDIIKALELPSSSPIKKSIKQVKRRSIIYITAATSYPRREKKPTTSSLALIMQFFIYNAIFMVFSNTYNPGF